MKGITIKLPDATMRRLAAEAQATGQSVAAVVRAKLEAQPDGVADSVHSRLSDLAGSLTGSGRSATNDRRKFRRA